MSDHVNNCTIANHTLSMTGEHSHDINYILQI